MFATQHATAEPSSPDLLSAPNKLGEFDIVEKESGEVFDDYRRSECSHLDAEFCRHKFLRSMISRIFKSTFDATCPFNVRSRNGTVDLGSEMYGSLNRWLALRPDQRLLTANVIVQSGTAVWLHGCRENAMTNDIDAW